MTRAEAMQKTAEAATLAASRERAANQYVLDGYLGAATANRKLANEHWVRAMDYADKANAAEE